MSSDLWSKGKGYPIMGKASYYKRKIQLEYHQMLFQH